MVKTKNQVLTLGDNVLDSSASLVRHEAKNREDDEAGKDTGAAVHQGNDDGISATTHTHPSI